MQQAGACEVALERPKWDAVQPIEQHLERPKWDAVQPIEQHLERPKWDTVQPIEQHLERPKWDTVQPIEQPAVKTERSNKGRGDTDTIGKHNTRYKAYCKAVKAGKLNPSINALSMFEYGDKRIGKTTAKEFLLAMEKSGVIQKTEKGGKTAWIRCV